MFKYSKIDSLIYDVEKARIPNTTTNQIKYCLLYKSAPNFAPDIKSA